MRQRKRLPFAAATVLALLCAGSAAQAQDGLRLYQGVFAGSHVTWVRGTSTTARATPASSLPPSAGCVWARSCPSCCSDST